ncbi:hypothetical protein EYB25_003179 [Talaromyces marneffei]|nr:hypothetical protein EYB25_003179 [Talaromyces marneffei]
MSTTGYPNPELQYLAPVPTKLSVRFLHTRRGNVTNAMLNQPLRSQPIIFPNHDIFASSRNILWTTLSNIYDMASGNKPSFLI